MCNASPGPSPSYTTAVPSTPPPLKHNGTSKKVQRSATQRQARCAAPLSQYNSTVAQAGVQCPASPNTTARAATCSLLHPLIQRHTEAGLLCPLPHPARGCAQINARRGVLRSREGHRTVPATVGRAAGLGLRSAGWAPWLPLPRGDTSAPPGRRTAGHSRSPCRGRLSPGRLWRGGLADPA